MVTWLLELFMQLLLEGSCISLEQNHSIFFSTGPGRINIKLFSNPLKIIKKIEMESNVTVLIFVVYLKHEVVL